MDGSQPGWVACEFKDAQGRRHTIVDKVPAFTSENLRADSAYPRPGILPCEVLSRWRDTSGRDLVRISTANPLGDESAEGLSVFEVEATKVSEGKAPVRRDWSAPLT